MACNLVTDLEAQPGGCMICFNMTKCTGLRNDQHGLLVGAVSQKRGMTLSIAFQYVVNRALSTEAATSALNKLLTGRHNPENLNPYRPGGLPSHNRRRHL
ncbi:hypothetical protein NSU_3289 [Novosphingobium pentaromativorans US6-1]|uniref:Uncharacterized protein n=1 Tax=Novosphingobium pentaromativorans US6-1 TaxID=1088721 RepID=G6EG18_9SPHN|nr:hypothetical protein NSU_3289 [Novosphingobium pentaromativorans US6-1]